MAQSVSVMANRDVSVIVLSAKTASELRELDELPDTFSVAAIGSADEILEEAGDKLQRVEVLLNGSGCTENPINAMQKLWPKLPNLKWVHSTAAGVGHLLWEGLTDSDITLTNAKGAFSSSLAEYAITACLYFAKKLPELQANQRQAKWRKLHVEELRGARLGIIGFGDIGQATARLGKAFGMNIAALRRRTELSKEEEAQGLEVYSPDRLTELTSSCDYLVTALPATKATQGFVNAQAFAAMQPHAIFINLGRGSTVDENALIKVLQEKKIRGAALDVFEEEPLPESSKLWALDNVLISPHCADMTSSFLNEATQQFVELAKLYGAGKPLKNICDKHAGY